MAPTEEDGSCGQLSQQLIAMYLGGRHLYNVPRVRGVNKLDFNELLNVPCEVFVVELRHFT